MLTTREIISSQACKNRNQSISFMGFGKEIVSINVKNPHVKDMSHKIEGIQVIHSNPDRAARDTLDIYMESEGVTHCMIRILNAVLMITRAYILGTHFGRET